MRTFYDPVVVSAIFYAVVCRVAGSTERDSKRLNKLVRRATSVLDCLKVFIEEVGERRMLVKLTSITDNTSHSLHETVWPLSSSFSNRLGHPQSKRKHYRRSFIPSAVLFTDPRAVKPWVNHSEWVPSLSSWFICDARC